MLGKVTREETPGAVELLEAAATPGPKPPEPAFALDDTALISYTSGTSGTPKGATNTHGNVGTNAAGLGSFSGLPAGSTLFGLAPLFHITGMVCEVGSAIDIGGTLALAYRFDAGVVLDAFLEHRPSYTVGPSTAYMALMAHPSFSRDHFASFALLYSGGAALPPAVVEAFRAKTGHYIHNGYGLTETTAGCVVVPGTLEAPIDPESGTISIGLPVPDTIVRILGENGEELPFGQAGEIAVEGPMVVSGYWNRPDATAEALPGGRLLTGDIGFMDERGWVYVVDRKKDMINASGFKVWPREVEDVLYTHPAVREAAVVGIADEYRGETVKAYVSPAPGVDRRPGGARGLVQGTARRLQVPAHHRSPRRAAEDHQRQDPAPRTASEGLMVETVRGAIAPEALGRVLMHEHLFVLSPEFVENYPEHEGFKEEEHVPEAIRRLKELKDAGIDTIVDPTVIGLGRYIPRVQRVAAEVEVNIVVATGLYTYNDVPHYLHFRGPGTMLQGEDPLVGMFVGDIREGIAGTGVKAGLLKCATDEPGVTPGCRTRAAGGREGARRNRGADHDAHPRRHPARAGAAGDLRVRRCRPEPGAGRALRRLGRPRLPDRAGRPRLDPRHGPVRPRPAAAVRGAGEHRRRDVRTRLRGQHGALARRVLLHRLAARRAAAGAHARTGTTCTSPGTSCPRCASAGCPKRTSRRCSWTIPGGSWPGRAEPLSCAFEST